MKKIITHNGQFHSDEVFAIAMLKLAFGEIDIKRVPHQIDIKDLLNADFVVDVGRRYDGKKYFDHHQFTPKEESRSSAGLELDYLIENGYFSSEWETVKAFIEKVDRNDIGVEVADEFSIISVISNLNNGRLHTDKQEKQFKKAIKIAKDTLRGFIKKDEEVIKARERVKERGYIRRVGNIKMLILRTFVPSWQKVVNGENGDYKEVDWAVWEDKKEKTIKVQNIPKADGSFKANGIPVRYIEDSGAVFLHKGNFFGVFKSKKDLYNYAEKINKEVLKEILGDRGE